MPMPPGLYTLGVTKCRLFRPRDDMLGSGGNLLQAPGANIGLLAATNILHLVVTAPRAGLAAPDAAKGIHVERTVLPTHLGAARSS